MAYPLRLLFLHFLPKFLLMRRPPARYQKRHRSVKNKAQSMLEEPWNWNASNHSVRLPNGPAFHRRQPAATVAPLAHVPEMSDPLWDMDDAPGFRPSATASTEEPRLGPDRVAVADSVDYIANHMEWNDGIKLVRCHFSVYLLYCRDQMDRLGHASYIITPPGTKRFKTVQ